MAANAYDSFRVQNDLNIHVYTAKTLLF